MNRMRSLLLAGAVLAALPCGSAQAGVRIGIGIGFPLCWPGPCYYPAYVAPAPVYYYAPGPYVVAAPPVAVQKPTPPPAPPEEQAPQPKPVQPQASAQPQPLSGPVVLKPVAASQTTARPTGDAERYMALLADADEGVRLDAATRLGRMRTPQAIDPLAATLAGDRSPAVREAAARGLALLGDPKALPALLRAANGDGDHDVRRAAQFAVEIIQTR
jgi:hypothetical protein